MPAPVPSPPLANAPAGVLSLRTLGTTSVEAAPGNDGRFATPTNAQTAAAAGKIPLADGTGKIALGWLDLTGYVPTSTHVDAGTGLSGGGDLTSSRTISMPNVGPGAGAIGGSSSLVRSLTLDAQGRVTAATATNIGALATGLLKVTTSTGALSTATAATDYVAPSTTITAGAGLSGGGDLSANRTISMPNIGPGAGALGGSGTVVESLTLDAQGRVTAATTVFGGDGIVTKTGNYPAVNGDHTILGDTSGGAFTVTLPTAVGRAGKIFIIKRISATANNLTIDTTSGQTIDGAATVVLSAQYAGRAVQSDNANWHVIGSF